MSSATEQPDPGLPLPDLLDDTPVPRRREARRDRRPFHDAGEPWRPGRWLWLALALVLVTSGVVWYADARVRADETSSIGRCEHALRDASAMSEIRMGAMVNYLRPSLISTRGVAQLHLADLMSGPARRLLPAVRRADRACEAVTVRPWHFALVTRRNAATAYSGALLTLLQTVAAQGRASFRHGATLVRLRKAAGLE